MNAFISGLSSRRILVLSCAAVGAVVLVIVSLARDVRGEESAQPAAFRPPLRLIAVNVNDVFEGSAEWRDYQAESGREEDRMNRAMEKRNQQLLILRNEYQNLAPGTEAIAEKAKEIEAALAEYKQVQEKFELEISRKQRDEIRKMFSKMAATIGDYAKENGIDVVLRKQDVTDLLDTGAQLDLVIGTADVLFVSEAYDASGAIIERLNRQYPGEIEER